MPFNQWWTFSEGLVETDRDEPGVYELGDSNQAIIYIGSSKEIRRRLKEHRAEPDSTCIKTNTASYRIEYTSNYKKREQELYMMSSFAQTGKLPSVMMQGRRGPNLSANEGLLTSSLNLQRAPLVGGRRPDPPRRDSARAPGQPQVDVSFLRRRDANGAGFLSFAKAHLWALRIVRSR